MQYEGGKIMEERGSRAAQWLTALSVVYVPLSIIILLSGSWMVNFSSNQWTRYLLFASWVSMVVSAVFGVFNMISLPAELRGRPVGRRLEKGEPGSEEGEREEPMEGPCSAVSAPGATEPVSPRAQGLLLAQATAFLLGLFLYMAFISWMILPEIALR